MKTLVVSDLHLGQDTVTPIYGGGEQLPPLIDAVDGLERVVLNGDTFDLLLDDAPLVLDRATAAERVRACAESRDGATLLAALARVTKRGGSVLVRAGNHDLELALDTVQAALVESFANAGAAVDRIQFEQSDEPLRFEAGGLRIAVTHGENTDPFNRWERHQLGEPEFRFPPGSLLVKSTLNQLKTRMRFIDLLKPDFQGAVLSALAIRPTEVRAVLHKSTLEILSAAIERSFSGSPFPVGDADALFDAPLFGAGLDAEEGNAVLDLLDGGLAFAADGPRPSLLRRALAKIGRAALRGYAAAHRRITGRAGEQFFDETPGHEEWKEAERLRTKYGADVVISGHTHARRFGIRDGLTYVNTGTWIGLLEMPAHEATLDEWIAFHNELASDPLLAHSQRVRIHGTACLVDPDDGACPVQLLGRNTPPPETWFRSPT